MDIENLDDEAMSVHTVAGHLNDYGDHLPVIAEDEDGNLFVVYDVESYNLNGYPVVKLSIAKE